MAGSVRARITRWLTAILALAILAGGGVAYFKRGEIQDYFLAQSFIPSKRVQEILTTIDLTPAGERIFLASKPTVGGREDFGPWCANVDHVEEGHVLGCYADQRIRLFEITDDRLDGVVEVTAAHELLHAAFSRIPLPEREQLTHLLQDTYSALIEEDPELEERMNVYEQLSPSAFANELHSVLGTEVSELPEELETHYAQWIADRTQIVDWYDSYHRVFTELMNRAESLSEQLETLRADIDARNQAYDEAVRQFNTDAADFKARNERFEFSGNPALFEATRDGLLAREAELTAIRDGLNADTNRFNELREELLALNDVSIELNDLLDSSTPAPKINTEPDSTPEPVV